MALHLLKLCVGVSSIEDLESWIAERRALATKAGQTFEQVHTTRMVPNRAAELLDGGSLYWVIRGEISVRQKLLDIRPFVDGEGNSFHANITRVSGALVTKNKWEHLFKPIEVSHPEIEAATAAPGEKRGE